MPVGSVTVVSSGTALPVVSSGHAVFAVSFRARTSNAGAVYIGDESVASSDGYQLDPGDTLSLSFRESVDLRSFFVDSETDGDVVDFAAVSA